MPDVVGIRGRMLRTEADGIVVVQVQQADRDLLKPFLRRYLARSQKAKELPILTFNFAFWYKRRTIDQNSLYWALLTILAFEVFGEFHHEEEIHEEILMLYSPRVDGPLTKKPVPKRSKELTTVEFSRLIEGLFKELAEHGVSLESSARIVDYWREWNVWRGGQPDDPLSGSYKNADEYRERIPYCEACLKYLGADEPGSIAHILSRGAGGADDDWNLFHFCDSCHTGINTPDSMKGFGKAVVQHQYGWEVFLEKYPHLKRKWERAHEKAGEAT